MIFLSHNHRDKQLVRQIAQTLCDVYGQDNIFYDEWSIRPGDSIIEEMNTGLEKCRFFFFFISKNSLNSNMVKLEWQSALTKYGKGIKFIPVILDDSKIPQIISATCYIDVHHNSLEVAIRQIIDVIDGETNTLIKDPFFSNLRAFITNTQEGKEIEFRAEHYMEPFSRYLVLVNNSEDDEIIANFPDFSEYIFGFNKDIKLSDGTCCNAVLIEVTSATAPNFPVRVLLKSNKAIEIQIIGIMHATSRQNFSSIPFVYTNIRR